jgi:hypothetical protein
MKTVSARQANHDFLDLLSRVERGGREIRHRSWRLLTAPARCSNGSRTKDWLVARQPDCGVGCRAGSLEKVPSSKIF